MLRPGEGLIFHGIAVVIIIGNPKTNKLNCCAIAFAVSAKNNAQLPRHISRGQDFLKNDVCFLSIPGNNAMLVMVVAF